MTSYLECLIEADKGRGKVEYLRITLTKFYSEKDDISKQSFATTPSSLFLIFFTNYLKQSQKQMK